jgi:hypothetical protein
MIALPARHPPRASALTLGREINLVGAPGSWR